MKPNPHPHRDVLHGHPSPLKGDDLLEVGVVLAGVGLGGPLHHVCEGRVSFTFHFGNFN